MESFQTSKTESRMSHEDINRRAVEIRASLDPFYREIGLSKDVIGAVDLKLTAEEITALEKDYRPHPILGHAQPSAKSMLKRTKKRIISKAFIRLAF